MLFPSFPHVDITPNRATTIVSGLNLEPFVTNIQADIGRRCGLYSCAQVVIVLPLSTASLGSDSSGLEHLGL